MSDSALWNLDDRLVAGVIGRRLCAWLIDVVLATLIAGVVFVGCLLFGLLTLGFGLGMLGLVPAVPAAYHVLFLISPLSATPGQRLLGLLVRRDADLGPPTLLQAIATTAGLMITLMAGVIWLGVAFFTVRQRTFHDMIAGLVVVNARELGPAATGRNGFLRA